MKYFITINLFLLFIIESSVNLTDSTYLENTVPIHSEKTINQTGIATWYGSNFQGKRTRSGESYDMYGFTAAHRSLPLQSIVRITNTANHRTAIVRINDRGPVSKKLVIDLSKITANNLDITRKGSGKVQIELLSNAKNPVAKIFETFRNIGKE